jgi:hypothetical protein
MPWLKRIDLTGKKFGKLLVISELDAGYFKCGAKKGMWLCKCECGKETKVRGAALKSGNIKSCGCVHAINETKYLKTLFKVYINSAKNRDIDFDLNFDLFCELMKGNCFYCGVAPSLPVSKSRKYRKDFECFTNGIDRIDSAAGYTKNNVVSCCKICNRAKLDVPPKEFLEWIQRIYEYTKSRT